MKKLIKIVFAVLICLNVFTTKIQADTQPDSSKISVSFDANQKKVVVEIENGYTYADSLTQFELTVEGWDDPWQAAFDSGDVDRDGNKFTVNTTYAINKNGTYPITLKADGYEDYSTSLVVDSFVELDPAVTSISFNATNKTVDVVCSSSDYFNAISEVYVSDNWNTNFNDASVVTKDSSNNSFSVLTTNAYGENGTYTFKIIATGYKTYSQQYDVDCYESGDDGGDGGDPVPSTITVAYSENTKLITVSSDSSYIEKVNSISLENEVAGYWGCPIDDAEIITFSGDKSSFTIDATFPIWYNGTYKITVYADGYQNYVKNDLVITGFHEPPEPREYPKDVNVSLNEDGDLIITSSDTHFIDDLVDEYSPGTNVLEGFSEETFKLGDEDIYKYYFGIHNEPNTSASSTRPLVKVNNSTVKFAVAQQLNGMSSGVYRGQILNDVEYILQFGLPGYTGDNSVSGKFTFFNSNDRIPVSHVKVYVADGYVIICADNNGLDFLNKMYHGQIAILDNWGVITDSIELSEKDRVKANDYDTISDTYDRVYKINTSTVTNPSEWTGLIDSTGYGQYCYDGRPFGGTTSISVGTFDVSKIGADGATVTGTDKVIGIYRLPDVSPVNGKSVVGWQIKDKGTETIRCVGEEIFVTSDTELYAIYENTPTPDPEKVDLEAIKVAILVNTIKKINVATNAFGASLESDTFISEDEKALGAAIWVETDLLTTDSEQHKQVERALELNNSYDTDNNLVLTFDINVFKQIGIDGNAIKISETDTAIEIALDLSSSEDAQKLAAAGKLGLYSIHEGKPQEVIRGIYNLQTKIYTVTISKFSTFAFVQAAEDRSTVIDTSEHIHNEITFDEWFSDNSLPEDPGNYYLSKDVTISSTWSVPEGITNLCLNGYGIKYTGTSGSVINVGSGNRLNIYDCYTSSTHRYTVDGNNLATIATNGDKSFTGGYITGGKGSYVYHTSAGDKYGGGAIVNEGILNIYGGTIIGNIAEKGGGIFNRGTLTLAGGKIMYNAGLWIENSVIKNGDGGGVLNYGGTFAMTGGEISNNESVWGGGVQNRSTFTVSGGTITNNTTVDGADYTKRASGVCLYETNTFQASGNPTISGNDNDNVYVDNNSVITINGTLSNTTPIGVTMENPGVFTSGLSGNGSISNFTSDDSNYTVTLNTSNEAQLTQQFTVSFDANGHGTAPAEQKINSGGKATKPADLTAEGYVFGGWYKEAGCSNAWNFDSDTVTSSRTLFAKWTEAVASVTNGTTVTYYANINSAMSAWDTGTTLTLLKDVSISSYNNGKTNTLDLNGHTFTTSGNFEITNGATLTINDSSSPNTGVFTKDIQRDQSLIWVYNGHLVLNGGTLSAKQTQCPVVDFYLADNTNGSFTMNGGKITGNASEGAIRFASSCSFTMTGGEISGLTTTNGLLTGKRTTPLTISGSAVIKNNKKGENTENVYLSSGQVITIGGVLDSSASIGVTMANPGVFTSGLSEKGNASNFTSDNNNYSVSLNSSSSEAQLVKAIQATATGYSGSYDGQPHGISVTVTDPSSGSVVKYGTEEGTYDLDESPTITNVSDSPKTVYYKVTASGYIDKTGSATITLSKAENPATVSGTATVKRGGSTVDLEGNVTLNGASGTVSYAISGETNGCTMQGSVLKSGANTGTVTVNVTVAVDDNYNALDTKTITVTITEKDTQTITAENVKVTYGDTGKAVSAKVSDPETGGGTISYAVKTGSEDYIEVDDESGALTIKKAGTATVTVTAFETDNYAQATKDVTVTINKADPDATAPSASATYGQTLSEVTLTNPDGNSKGSWSWADSSASVGNVGSRTFKANFTPQDTTNYNSVSNVDVTVTVAEADPSYTAPSAKTGLVYNKSAQQLITEGSTEDGTMYYCIGEDATTPTAFGTDIPKATDAGTYYVFYHVKGDDNHKDTGSLGPVEVTITQADPAKLLPYGFAVEAEPGDSLSSIELPEGWVWSDTAEYIGDEGTRTFKAKYTGDTVNYSQDPVDITVNVTKAFYDYVSGSSSGTWTKDSLGSLSFTFKRSQKDKERTFNSFVSASYDGGKTMTEDTDFSKASGSLIISLNVSLLNSLNVGTHTLTVRFEDGTATTTFRVIEKSSGGGSSLDDYQPPRTGIE